MKRLLPGHESDLARRPNHHAALVAPRGSSRGPSPFPPTTSRTSGFRKCLTAPLGFAESATCRWACCSAAGSIRAPSRRLFPQQAGDGVHSFTVGFDEDGYDEGPLARAVAERWRLTSHALKVTPEELKARYSRASWLNDEPLAHGSDMHLWAIAQYAKPHVTVLLSGEGADECLGGYVRYRPLRHPSLLTPARRGTSADDGADRDERRVRKLTRFLTLKSVRDLVLFNACDVLPADLPPLGMTTSAQISVPRANRCRGREAVSG